MSGRDDRANEPDRASARRDLRAAVREGLVDEKSMSERERQAAADARPDREAAAGDRRAAAEDRAATAEARRASERSGK
jgi:hypothetical protein